MENLGRPTEAREGAEPEGEVTVPAAEGGQLTRRRLLQVAAGAALASAAGCSSKSAASPRHATSTTSPDLATQQPPKGPYYSAPSLDPAPTKVLVPANGTADGLVFITRSKTKHHQHGPMIMDNQGQVVWFSPSEPSTTNLRVQRYKGAPVISWWHGKVVPPGYGKGSYLIADTSYKTVTEVFAGNGLHGDLHEFVITAEGTALFTAFREEDADLSSVGGAVNGRILNSLFQEVDIATGKVLAEWDAREHVPFSESYVSPPTKASAEWDWFHMNSIDVDYDSNLIISARHTWTVYKLDRSTGAVIWRLNGKRSDFEMGPGTRFSWQHHAIRHPGEILTVFDDGAGPRKTAERSRGLKLAIDKAAKKVSLVEQYLPDPSVLANSQGSVEVLPNGNVFVGWGEQPYLSEYTAGGHMLFNVELLDRSYSYRAFRFPWVGEPQWRPGVAARRASTGRLLVYASWNGATQVDSWQVLAGPRASKLEKLGPPFAKAGFETEMQVSTADGYVAVRALDAKGKPLGTSDVVRAL